MKWLLLTSLIIVGDLHLSGQLLDIYPPYLFGGMYLALLLTGIFVLNMRKKSLVRNFNQAVTQQQRFKKITRKKIRQEHQNRSQNLYPITQLGLALLSILLLIVPGFITSFVGIALCSHATSSRLTKQVISKNMEKFYKVGAIC